ncbi:MAG: DUF4422 domain-containing protein [Actinomycetaceae bacterium]|nr:DUF4422 domain-containing protein [Actinomycetaceae bacterium]
MSQHITIAVATHKKYWMPHDTMYLPVHVGAALSNNDLGYQRDDRQENSPEKTTETISHLNHHYSELTALYWAWKNLSSKHIGLAHYRRHFAGNGERGILSHNQAALLLKKSPIVLPKKRHYYIETLESHYAHTFDPQHLELLKQTLTDISPKYLNSYSQVLQHRSAHIFNMMIMRSDLLDEYCSWLFPILFAVEKELDYSNMSDFEARVLGRLSERLMDVWIETHHHRYEEAPFVYMEKVNWLNKGKSFLEAKFLGKKYSASF